MKKAVLLLLVLAVAGVFGWRLWQKALAARAQASPAERGARAVAVEVQPVATTTIRDVAQFTGSLFSKALFVAAPKVAGRLKKLTVNIGDPVRQGQTIALLDDDEYAQQVGEAQAELEVAKANIEEARSALEIEKREYDRVQALRQKNIASESELDSGQARYQAQEAKYKVALAQVDQKDAALKAAEVRLSYTRIQAAWEDGEGERVVGERFVDEGAMLRANDPIVSIIDLSSLTAVIHVIERDYSKITVGQDATVTTDAYPERLFRGRIVRVAPLLKETSREARVEVEIPNPEGVLKPGMFVRAEIEFDRHDNATVVPFTALARREGREGVFLADLTEKKAHFVPVTVGIVSGEQAEVTAPPLSGMVVTLGQHLLTDGSTIAVAQAAGTGEAASGPGPTAEAGRRQGSTQ